MKLYYCLTCGAVFVFDSKNPKLEPSLCCKDKYPAYEEVELKIEVK